MVNKLNRKHAGFTLVEIMIVVAIIALLAAIAVPGFLRARKRSQASKILNDLRMIDAAVDQYAIETNRTTGNTVAITDWTNYVKERSILYSGTQRPRYCSRGGLGLMIRVPANQGQLTCEDIRLDRDNAFIQRPPRALEAFRDDLLLA